jgi:predicted RNase H-like HicB family nuclease
MENLYTVTAIWDGEATVWVAQSDDVPGLATEAPTEEALTKKLTSLIPELLELNNCRPKGERLDVVIRYQREAKFSLAA